MKWQVHGCALLALVSCSLTLGAQGARNVEARFNKVGEWILRDGGGSMSTHLVNDSTVLTFDSKLHVNLWRLKGVAKPQWISGNSNRIASYNFAFCAATACFAVADTNATHDVICIYKIADDKIILAKLLETGKRSAGPTVDFSFSANGKRLAYSSYSQRTIVVLKADGFAVETKLHHPDYIQIVRFLDANRLLAVSREKNLSVWDLSKKSPVKIMNKTIEANGDFISDVRYDNTADRLVMLYNTSAHNNFRIMTLSLAEKDSVPKAEGPTKWNKRIPFSYLSPTCRFALIATSNLELFVYDVSRSTVVAEFVLRDTPTSALFYDKDKKFAVSCYDGSFYLFSQ